MRHELEVELSDELIQEIQTASRLLIPINIGGQHWSLAYIDTNLGLVMYCDSWLGTRDSKGEEYIQGIKWFFEALVGVELPNGVVMEDMPQQEDGYSCGAFVCLAAKRLLQGQDLDFAQNDIYPFRRAMAAALSGQTLE